MPITIKGFVYRFSLVFFLIFLFVPFSYSAAGPGLQPEDTRKKPVTDYDGTPPSRSVHEEQMLQMEKEPAKVSEDALEIKRLESRDAIFPETITTQKIQQGESRKIGEDFIVFGYAQSEKQIYHTRWQALTHIGCLFIYFNEDGHLTSTSRFTGRSSFLKAGGAAQAAGVKVIMVVTSFDDDPGGAIESVMTNPSKRAVMISEIVSLLQSDSYSHGVSMDLEFSWGTTIRDGITAFMAELRAALDAVDPDYELSIYTNAIFNGNQWNFDAVNGLTPHVDYMMYSMYDWGSGYTPHAISDFNNCLGSSRMQAYLNEGLPPEKLVPTVSAYSRKWGGTNQYNVAGSSRTSQGFTDGLYDTTLNPNYGGPFDNHYVEGDEGAWYTFNDGENNVVTWDSPEAMEYKIRHALSMQDPNGLWNGRRLGGVGFWSLYWMAETSSYDPRTSSSVSRTRTYPHIYQLCQEILAEPGQTCFLIEGFEGLDPRWRDPNDSPDTTGDTNGDCSRAQVNAPAGAGQPAGSIRAVQVTFDFESSGFNRAVFAHEVLASNWAPSLPDMNATLAVFDSTTKISASLYTPTVYSGYQVRMMVVDGEGELEISSPYSLHANGWRTLSWDLTDSAQVHAYTTEEPAFKNGDGALDSVGDGVKDIGFVGFLIEGSGARNGNVVFDEIFIEHINPDGKDYTINEFRYDGSALEFIEVFGPAGPMPSGLEFRVYDGIDGSVAQSADLGGETIVDRGDGFGYFVLGDSDVPGVNNSTGFSTNSDDILDDGPVGLQLYHPLSGCVYDSVVYEAFGGLEDLIRRQTHGVADQGYPWLGQIAGGTDGQGRPYTKGRYPDGNNSFMNAGDFSYMAASPGRANGGNVTSVRSFDFSSVPAGAFQTFQNFSVQASAVGPSPGGGNVHRCVDTAGGGVITVFGDAALGADGKGCRVEGSIYIPSAGQPAQAIGVGICGSQGSVFFTQNSDNYGYESGYWLIFENRDGVGLADGLADHPGVFHFVHATHDNMDGEPVELLGAKTLALTGAEGGNWTSFYLEINPESDASNEQLTAKINGVEIFQGRIPEGGPHAGAFQAGFRENHAGAPTAVEGTWIDSVTITPLSAQSKPVWEVY